MYRGDKIEVGKQEMVIQARFVLWAECFCPPQICMLQPIPPLYGFWRS